LFSCSPGKSTIQRATCNNFGARYYIQSIGRFNAIDPVNLSLTNKDELKAKTGQKLEQILSNPQTLNNYSYTINNPIKYTDPDGEWLDTVVDIAFVAYDIGRIASQYISKGQVDKSEWNALGLDAGSMLIPGVVGLGTISRVAKGVDKAVDAGKVMEKVGDGIKLLGTKGDNLLQGVENKSLVNVIKSLYKEHKAGVKIIGDGGAADALRHELKTNELVGSKSHLTKVQQLTTRLEKILQNEKLSSSDYSKARTLLNDLKDAQKGGGL
jgi:RHS repeat-associated protein